jgi:hypothetical protein
MPRHNLTKVAPYVQEMCRKHGLDYQKKSLFQAFADIVTLVDDVTVLHVIALHFFNFGLFTVLHKYIESRNLKAH